MEMLIIQKIFEQGFIEDKYYEDISVNYSTILKMPQLSKERLEELYYQFNSLVYGACCKQKD